MKTWEDPTLQHQTCHTLSTQPSTLPPPKPQFVPPKTSTDATDMQWFKGIFLPTLLWRSLPEIIRNHLMNYFHERQLQSESHHHQKPDWTSCWWNLSVDYWTECFRKGTAAPLHCRRTNLQGQSCYWENGSLKTSRSIPGLSSLIFNGNIENTFWTGTREQKFVTLVRKKPPWAQWQYWFYSMW